MKWIVPAILLMQCSALAGIPSTVRLKVTLDVPIIIDGISKGTLTVPAGTALSVHEIRGDNISLDYRGSFYATAISNTDFGDQMAAINARAEKKKIETDEIRKAEEKKTQEQEAKKRQIAYEGAKKSVDRTRRFLDSYIGSDRETAKMLIANASDFIKCYDSGDEKTRLISYSNYTQILRKTYLRL